MSPKEVRLFSSTQIKTNNAEVVVRSAYYRVFIQLEYEE